MGKKVKDKGEIAKVRNTFKWSPEQDKAREQFRQKVKEARASIKEADTTNLTEGQKQRAEFERDWSKPGGPDMFSFAPDPDSDSDSDLHRLTKLEQVSATILAGILANHDRLHPRTVKADVSLAIEYATALLGHEKVKT